MGADPKENSSETTERQEILNLMKIIKEHPCLYDTASPQYSDPVHTQKAWAEIAEKCNSDIPNCKDNWEGIKTAFRRSKRNRKSNETQEPFTKVADDANVTQKSNQDKKDVAETVLKEDKSDDHNNLDNIVNNNDTDAPEDKVIAGFNNLEISRCEIDVTNNNNINRLSIGPNGSRKRKIKLEDLIKLPKKMLLLSLMPVVDSFTAEQMEVFKRDVRASLDRLKSDIENHN